MRTTTETTKPILEELRSELKQLYKGRFKRLILYGSYARGEATENSDIDVVAVIEGIENPVKELGKLSDLISRLSLKYDTLLSLYPISTSDFEERNSPLLLNVKKEGISV
jgi:predicted nucleotidyltransferase